MLHKINLHNVLFIDIETVPLQENFSDLPETEQYLFSDKTAYQRAEGQSASSFMKEPAFGPSLERSSVFRWVILPPSINPDNSGSRVFPEKKKNFFLTSRPCWIITIVVLGIFSVRIMAKSLIFPISLDVCSSIRLHSLKSYRSTERNPGKFPTLTPCIYGVLETLSNIPH